MADPLPLARPRSRAGRPVLASPDTRLVLRDDSPDPGVVVVRADGEIDLANREALAAALSPAAADPATRLLVCDLSTTTFLACAGLAVLLEAKAVLATRGARLRVVAADPTVLRVMDVTGQRDALDVHPTLAGALAHLAPPTAAAPGSDLAELRAALDRAVEQTTELAATWGRLAERVSGLDTASLVDGRGERWTPRETLAEMAEDLRALQNHLATGALLAAPTVEDLGHLRDAPR